MSVEDVFADLKSFLQSTENLLMTDSEFEERISVLLDNFSTVGLVLQVKVSLRAEILAIYGKTKLLYSQADLTSSESAGKVMLQVTGWKGADLHQMDAVTRRESFNRAVTIIGGLINNHWGSRNDLTLLPHFQEVNNRERLENAISAACGDRKIVTVAHLDMDHFKEVNNPEDQGDAILREFGERLRCDFGRQALVLRKGGEEFSLFFRDYPFDTAVSEVERFRARMETEAFQVIGRPNTCSIGVASFPLHIPLPTIGQSWTDTVLQPAMTAESFAKSEGRNCIRLAGSNIPIPPGQVVQNGDLLEAAFWSRQNLLPGQKPTFGDEYHSYLASHLAKCFTDATIAGLQTIVDGVIARLGIKLHCSRSGLSYSGGKASPSMHVVKLAAIVLHALLRNALVGCGPLRADSKLFLGAYKEPGSSPPYLAIRIDGQAGSTVKIRMGEFVSEQESLEEYVGRPWRSREIAEGDAISRWLPTDNSATSLSPCLLIAVGERSITLGLEPWVADVVQVDSRPVEGGGLPDFWQSNVSRVIHSVLRNPNINHILFLGDINNAPRTAKVLADPTQYGSESKVARRLSLDVETINLYRDRKLKITHARADRSDATQALAQIYFHSEETLAPRGDPLDLRAEHRRKGRIQMPAPAHGDGLKSTDGLRCKSLAEAYPKVIRLLRDTEGATNLDHMGRPFKELPGFKLVIEEPLSEYIPDYWLDEQNELDSYFQNQFIDKKGLFGARLQAWGSRHDINVNQIDNAAEAAVKALSEKIANRRIILFIAEPGDNWPSPLGLVCAHVLPRKYGERWQVGFQWVWRTVEALVGLPFSAYGSIRQSEKLLEAINKRLSDAGHPHAAMGELVYLALSLHLFLDEGDAEIARAVVTSAIA